MPRLCPCPRCARHLRTSETTCPFCGSGVRFEIVSTPFEGRFDRLRREAQLVFGASLFGVVTASCQPEHPAREPLTPPQSELDETAGEPYAQAPVSPEADAGADITPTSDAGAPADGGGHSGIVPIYGESGFFISKEIAFESGSTELDAKGHETLALVKEVMDEGSCDVVIDGHADRAEPRPKDLSKRRAEVVRRALLELGVERSRLGVEAHGTSQPATRPDEPARPNARVSFRLHQHGKDAGGGVCFER